VTAEVDGPLDPDQVSSQALKVETCEAQGAGRGKKDWIGKAGIGLFDGREPEVEADYPANQNKENEKINERMRCTFRFHGRDESVNVP